MQTPTNNDPIAASLGITPIIPNNTPVIIQPVNSGIEADYVKSKSNIYEVLDRGQEALAGALDVAALSQEPRAYEVVSQLMKTLSDVSKDLLQISKQKRDLDTEVQQQEAKVINNNVFVGSTAELQKHLSTQKNELRNITPEKTGISGTDQDSIQRESQT